MKVLAIIPARGGSKGIPKKNVIPLMGKPLIQYTIEAAQKSTKIDKIFLSTDSTEIIDVAKQLNLDCNYVRPDHLADDQASTIDVVLDALQWLETNEGYTPDTILLLQPTSPLRSSKDIDNAIELFMQKNQKCLVSVHEMSEHPYECVQNIHENDWSYVAKQSTNATRRQDYKKGFYYINGAIYMTNIHFLKKEKVFIQEKNTSFYVMPSERGIDIDEYYHLDIANALLKKRFDNE